MLGVKPKLTPNQQKQKQADQEMDGAARRVAQGSKNPLDLKAAALGARNLRKAMQIKKNPPKEASTLKKKGKVLEAEGDEVAPDAAAPAPADAAAPAPDAPAPPVEAQPLTTEGEVFLVNLAKDCLNTDLETINLNDMGIDRKLITQDVQPETAKEITKVLERIVGEEGIGETFNSKIDALIENFELSDLRSKLSIEDLKKNDRVVVLVPGSFKPPHKGHYEMVKQYSETYPQGQVHVLI